MFCCLTTTLPQQLPLILKSPAVLKGVQTSLNLLNIVALPSQVQVWRMVWSERLGRKREVRVPAGSAWWRQTADRLDCISWISRYSPVLSSSRRVCFAAGCWGGTIVASLAAIAYKQDNSYIFNLGCIVMFFSNSVSWNEHTTSTPVYTPNILKSVFMFNLSIQSISWSGFNWFFLCCCSSRLVAPRWSSPTLWRL